MRPSSHTSIAGSFATSISRSRKFPSACSRKSSICPFVRLGIFVGLGREHPRREAAVADLAGDLRVGGGEVVVPEERHLLLQRALRVHHPEQPALPGIEDVVRRLKAAAAAARHPDISRPADERIHIVGNLGVVEKARHRRGIAGKRQARVRLDLFLAGAESGPPVEMVDLLLSADAHARGLQAAWKSEILRSHQGRGQRLLADRRFRRPITEFVVVERRPTAAAAWLDRAIQAVVT